MSKQELKNKLLATEVFIDNEYLDQYCELIISNLNQEKIKCQTQGHHIVPKCYFISNELNIDNSEENLINLLYKDHILAHYYLCLCTEGNLQYKLANAFFHLTARKWNYEDFDPETDLSEYQRLYEGWILYRHNDKDLNCKISKAMKGKRLGFKHSEKTKQKMKCLRPNYKRNSLVTEETRQKISISTKGKPHAKMTSETKEKISKTKQGIKHSQNHKIKISKSLKGKSRSKEAIEKQKETIANNPNWGGNKGHKQSDFQKSQMSKARTGYVRSEEEIEKQKKSNFNRCAVQNLNTGEVFRNSAEAERFYSSNGKSNGAILEAIKQGHLAYGCFWVKLKGKAPLSLKEIKDLKVSLQLKKIELQKRNKKLGVKIKCINTGEIFNSVKEAGIKYGFSYGSLKQLQQYNAGGMQWEEYTQDLQLNIFQDVV